MDWWRKLPEWSRWILCWPIIIVLTIATGLLTSLIASTPLDRLWIPKAIATTVCPAIATFIAGPILFFLIYEFVPRKQAIVTGIFVAATSVLTAMSFVRWYCEITGAFGAGGIEVTDVLQTLTAVSVSWYWFFYFRREY